MSRIHNTGTKAGKEARAYAEVSADGGEEVHNVHGLIPGLVVHHSQGGERAPVRRPEVPLVVAKHSLYVLTTRACVFMRVGLISHPQNVTGSGQCCGSGMFILDPGSRI
jgi:hypothetical protein